VDCQGIATASHSCFEAVCLTSALFHKPTSTPGQPLPTPRLRIWCWQTRWAVRGGNWVRRTETSLSGGTLLYSVFFNNKPAPLTSHMHYFCTRERDHVHSFLRHIDYCGNIVSHIAVGHSVGDCITELALHTFRITIDRGDYTTAYTTMVDHGGPWRPRSSTMVLTMVAAVVEHRGAQQANAWGGIKEQSMVNHGWCRLSCLYLQMQS